MADMKLGTSPFVLHADLEGDSLTFPGRRRHALVRALWIFLVFWSLGCFAVGVKLLLDEDPILESSVGGLAVGWFFAAFLLISGLTEKEVLRREGPYLKVIHQSFGLGRPRRFRLADIRQVSVEPRPPWVETVLIPLPFAIWRDYGSISFACQGRRVLLLPGMEEGQAGMVVGWLKKRLPEASELDERAKHDV